MQAKYKEELLEIRTVLEHQENLKDTLLSDSQVTYAEDLKEKLMFIQTNVSEAQTATAKAEEALKHVPQKNVQTPAQLLGQQAMK